MYRLIFSVALLQFLQTVHGFQKVIFVNPAVGEDSLVCLTCNSDSSPCAHLTWVLQQGRQDSTKYILAQGTHTLTDNIQFEDLKHLAFTGSSSTVQCTSRTSGIAFTNVTNITIQGITFRNCSSLRSSTSRKLAPDSNEYQFQQFYVALYFSHCSDVFMRSVVVTESPDAHAVVMYNTLGSNIIRESSFTFNRWQSNFLSEYPGGGGVYIEWTYDDSTCLTFDSSTSRFLFSNVTLADNKASSLQEQDAYIIPHQRVHSAFGKGGGLAVIFKGNASDIYVKVLGCTFERNEASWGGGLLVEYQDLSSNNSVTVDRSQFVGNGIPLPMSRMDVETAGGGVRVGHYVYDSRGHSCSKNKFLLRESNFSDNNALEGGGVSVILIRQIVEDHEQLFEVNIHNTNFEENRAQVGAALKCSLFPLFALGLLPVVTVSSSQFTENSIDIENYATSIREQGMGTVYSHGIPIWFQNEAVFTRNKGSALAVAGTYVNFSNTTATFRGNEGKHGGAVNLLGSAFLVINNYTIMLFENNIALVRGGAISNSFIEKENFKSYPNCFFQHIDPFLDPDNWGATFTFVDNSAGLQGDAIYTSSLYPCVWAGGERASSSEDILCWTGWNYYSSSSLKNCSEEISTDTGCILYKSVINSSLNASLVDYPDNHNQILPLRMFPGEQFKLPLMMSDDLGQVKNTNNIFSARITNSNLSQVNPRFNFVTDNYIEVDGLIDNNSTLLLLSIGNERDWEVKIEIELKKCPPGFSLFYEPNLATSKCRCSQENDFHGLVQCSSTSDVYILNGYWLGTLNDSDPAYYASLCLPYFCWRDERQPSIKLPEDGEKLDELLCGRNNRKGILCGECVKDYGPSINTGDYKCIPCKSKFRSLIAYIFYQYVPLLAMFVFIIVFNVRLTNGPANAFIFYAQAVSSTFDLSADGHIPLNLITNHSEHLLLAYRAPYGIMNLNFIEKYVKPLCISSQMSALDILMLQYLVALFPLIMIVVVLLLVKLRDGPVFSFFCRCRCSLKCPSKFLFQHCNVYESLLHAFSAFLLLSYVKFSLTSSYLTDVHAFYATNGSEVGERRAYYAGQYTLKDPKFWKYFIPGCVVLVLFTLPPLILFNYPVVWLEKCIIIKVRFLRRLYPAGKVHMFLDTFQGCYKNNRRFFAGMYFAFRLTINITFILTDTWFQQFVIQQVTCTVFIFIIAFFWPYREEKWYVNYVDLLIFTNLALVNAISLYLFVYSKFNQRSSHLPKWPFVVQYVLVLLPLLYIILYVAWQLLTPSKKDKLKNLARLALKKMRREQRNSNLRSTLMCTLDGISKKITQDSTNLSHSTTEIALIRKKVCSTDLLCDNSDSSVNSQDSDNDDHHLKSLNSDDHLEALLIRAGTQNTYRRSMSVKASSHVSS